MIKINNEKTGNEKNDNETNNTYNICSEYIISLVDLLYSKLDNFFSILEDSIENSLENNTLEVNIPSKKLKLKSIRDSIKELCNKEIDKCKELFRNEIY